MSVRRCLAAALVAASAFVFVAADGTAAGAASLSTGFLSTPALAGARLSGTYAVSGVITTAVGIPGESAGQRVRRSWTFVSPCRSGACATLGLRRQRAGGTDPLFLRQLAPGLYEGSATYPAAVQCQGRTYPAGATVPYRLRVIVTSAAPAPDGTLIATGFSASYTGGAHVGHTRCIQPPVHDAAAYSGILSGP